MITLHIIIATAIFSVMFAYRNYWQIEQQKVTQDFLDFNRALDQQAWQYSNDLFKAKWHKWQFALQIYIGVAIAFISFMNNYSLLNSLGHGLLFGATFWLIFDTILGYLLTKSLFHVDSNGIGTIYKDIAGYFTFTVLPYIREKMGNGYTHILESVENRDKFAGYLLFISKILFLGISVLISLI